MITRSTRGATWALLLAAGVLLQGCMWPLRTPFEASAPREIPAGVDGTVGPDARTTLRLDGIDVRMETRNQHPRGIGLLWLVPFPFVLPLPASEVYKEAVGTPPPPPGLLQLLFVDLRTREPGFSFNPMSVLLQTEDASVAVPPRSYLASDGPAGQRPEASTADSSFSVEPSEKEWTSFVLAYDAPSDPEIPFRLVFGGLERRGEELPPVELSFSKRTGRSWLFGLRTGRPEELVGWTLR